MSDLPPEEDVASRWRREASEELRAAEVVAAHDEIPDRVAGFHAHLAAEKALKALLIDRGIEVPRIHDLIGLQRLLPEFDQARLRSDDLEALNPWTVEGRYPADLPDPTTARSMKRSPQRDECSRSRSTTSADEHSAPRARRRVGVTTSQW